jgi:hypothetical protein
MSSALRRLVPHKTEHLSNLGTKWIFSERYSLWYTSLPYLFFGFTRGICVKLYDLNINTFQQTSLLKTTTASSVTLHIPLNVLLSSLLSWNFRTNWWNTDERYVGRHNNIHQSDSWFRVWSSLSFDERRGRDRRAWNMEAICNSVHIVRYFTPPSAPHPLTTNHPSRETRPGVWNGSFWACIDRGPH